MDPIRYSFRTEWIDKVADLKRFYILNYYEKSGGRADVEMVRSAQEGLPLAHWLLD